VKETGLLLHVDKLYKAYAVRGMKDILLFRRPRYVNALNALSLQLHPGQITALLGPNGAGKTTLINILCDLTRADSGTVSVAGFSIPEQSLQAQGEIGYVTTNDRSFFWRLSGRKNLEFFAVLQGLSIAQARQRTQELLERFNLAEQAERPFLTYSTGMKKRLGIARAFLQDPTVLLMDEPTNGLDTKSTEELLDLVKREMTVSKKTVLWATHRADEVERLCDRVIVLIGGRIYFDDTIEAFRAVSRRHQIFSIEIHLPVQAGLIEGLLPDFGLELDGDLSGRTARLTGKGDEARLSVILAALIAREVQISQVERHAEPLYKIFSHLQQASSSVESVAS